MGPGGDEEREKVAPGSSSVFRGSGEEEKRAKETIGASEVGGESSARGVSEARPVSVRLRGSLTGSEAAGRSSEMRAEN